MSTYKAGGTNSPVFGTKFPPTKNSFQNDRVARLGVAAVITSLLPVAARPPYRPEARLVHFPAGEQLQSVVFAWAASNCSTKRPTKVLLLQSAAGGGELFETIGSCR